MIQIYSKVLLILLNGFVRYIERNKLTNSQEFINFLDKINEISVKY